MLKRHKIFCNCFPSVTIALVLKLFSLFAGDILCSSCGRSAMHACMSSRVTGCDPAVRSVYNFKHVLHGVLEKSKSFAIDNFSGAFLHISLTVRDCVLSLGRSRERRAYREQVCVCFHKEGYF